MGRSGEGRGMQEERTRACLPGWLDGLYDPDEMRAADRFAMERRGILEVELAEKAGAGRAGAAARRAGGRGARCAGAAAWGRAAAGGRPRRGGAGGGWGRPRPRWPEGDPSGSWSGRATT